MNKPTPVFFERCVSLWLNAQRSLVRIKVFVSELPPELTHPFRVLVWALPPVIFWVCWINIVLAFQDKIFGFSVGEPPSKQKADLYRGSYLILHQVIQFLLVPSCILVMLRGALPSTKKCSSLLVASGIISAAILGVIPGALLTQGITFSASPMMFRTLFFLLAIVINGITWTIATRKPLFLLYLLFPILFISVLLAGLTDLLLLPVFMYGSIIEQTLIRLVLFSLISWTAIVTLRSCSFRLCVLFSLDSLIVMEAAIVPFVLYYSRLFTVGMSSLWGMVLATFGSRVFDTLLILIMWFPPKIIQPRKDGSKFIKIYNMLLKLAIRPFQDFKFYSEHTNIVWTGGVISTIFCSGQLLMFSDKYMRPNWREYTDGLTVAAFVLLLASDLFSIGLLTYVGRRREGIGNLCVDEKGTGLTRPLAWDRLLFLWYGNAFAVVWSTWRVYVSLLCVDQVRKTCELMCFTLAGKISSDV